VFVVYTPENGDPNAWEFNPRRVRSSQAILIENRYGKQWDVFVADLMRGSMSARRVLLWHLIRQTHATLRFEDTPDFFPEELVVEFSRAELVSMREAVDENSGISDEDKAIMLSAIDTEIEKAAVGWTREKPSRGPTRQVLASSHGDAAYPAGRTRRPSYRRATAAGV
jgi:hypothetical protein